MGVSDSDYSDRAERRRGSVARNDVQAIARERDRLREEGDGDKGFDDEDDLIPPIEGQIENLRKKQGITVELLSQLEDHLRPYLTSVSEDDEGKSEGGTKEHSELWHALDSSVSLQQRVNDRIMLLIRRVER